ncbi:glycosyltransferase [Nocardiopsis alba]|uniref:glycosyltransferase n=1 Tax=Nocardiopsis alba TaxID=53437 RepID=UPI00339FFE85
MSHRGRVERVEARVFRNDWSALTPPVTGHWTPELGVSVVIPARGGQEGLDLALASLSVQTYPDHLLEVVVVDDHSSPPLRLPEHRPRRCRIVSPPDGGWGAGYARAYGAHASTGDILLWMDADMIACPEFVEAQARWHHAHAECVTLGRIRFSDTEPRSPEDLLDAIRSDDLTRVLTGDRRHEWVEHLIESSDLLRDADHLGFHAHVGAASAVRRSLYEAAGGVDPDLDLGQDTEFGYRLWQAGAVMVPERSATAWHVGTASTARTRLPSERFRTEVLAELMPHPHAYRERVPDPRRRIPLVHAVVDVTGASYDLVRGCVDRLLRGTETDLAITLVADWEGVRTQPIDLDLRLIQANYLREPRISFASTAPRTGFPSPFLLQVPVAWGLGELALSRLLAGAERSRSGLTELLPAAPPSREDTGVRLWRTRALARAMRVHGPGEELSEVVDELHGRYRIHGGQGTLTDLTLHRSVPPIPRPVPEAERVPEPVEPREAVEAPAEPAPAEEEPVEERRPRRTLRARLRSLWYRACRASGREMPEDDEDLGAGAGGPTSAGSMGEDTDPNGDGPRRPPHGRPSHE